MDAIMWPGACPFDHVCMAILYWQPFRGMGSRLASHIRLPNEGPGGGEKASLGTPLV